MRRARGRATRRNRLASDSTCGATPMHGFMIAQIADPAESTRADSALEGFFLRVYALVSFQIVLSGVFSHADRACELWERGVRRIAV